MVLSGQLLRCPDLFVADGPVGIVCDTSCGRSVVRSKEVGTGARATRGNATCVCSRGCCVVTVRPACQHLLVYGLLPHKLQTYNLRCRANFDRLERLAHLLHRPLLHHLLFHRHWHSLPHNGNHLGIGLVVSLRHLDSFLRLLVIILHLLGLWYTKQHGERVSQP